MQIPQLQEVEAAIARMCSKLQTVATQFVPISQAIGRILAKELRADRDSPPLDVSAMDGYAFRLSDLKGSVESKSSLPLAGIAYAGKAPMTLPSMKAVQIFTGGCVPVGADCVIRREDTIESSQRFELKVPLESLKQGQNIRRRGENVRAGEVVLQAGTTITTETVGGLASFGESEIEVRRQLSAALLTSGDELIDAGSAVEPWQIRDSNGPTLRAWIEKLPWVRLESQSRVGDDLDSLKQAIWSALATSDFLVITGGVSAGDTDFVPRAVLELGGETIFHRLPIRPGKPVFGAILGGKPIFGLPGNPVSAAVTARVIAQPVLECLAGKIASRQIHLSIIQPDEKRLPLVWYRLIQLDQLGVRLVESEGSGDLVSLSQSDGFAEVPPGQSGGGPWRVWLW